MSADNGIYIIKNSKGYRVIEAQAIDNLWWWDIDGRWEKRDKINPSMVEDYFKNSKYYNTIEEAYWIAEKLIKEIMDDDFCPICEYGIIYLGEI